MNSELKDINGEQIREEDWVNFRWKGGVVIHQVSGIVKRLEPNTGTIIVEANFGDGDEDNGLYRVRADKCYVDNEGTGPWPYPNAYKYVKGIYASEDPEVEQIWGDIIKGI